MYTTFSQALDSLFGGYQAGRIHHFVGDAGTGKTTLSSYIPIVSMTNRIVNKQVPQDKRRFIVACADGSFSIDRLKQIAEAHNADWDYIKRSLIYYDIVSFEHQHSLITRDIMALIEVQGIKPLLVAIDPMTTHYRTKRLERDRKERMVWTQELLGYLERQMQSLNHIARVHGAVATVTNWPKSEVFRSETWRLKDEFIGGNAFVYYPSLTVKLETVKQYPKIVKATLLKHRFREEFVDCEFAIDETGVKDVEQER